MSQTRRGKRLLRKKEARARLGVGKTKFQKDYVKTGRIHLVPISERIEGVVEEELDALIEEIIAERNATKPSSRIPAARDSGTGRFVEAPRKSTKEIRT